MICGYSPFELLFSPFNAIKWKANNFEYDCVKEWLRPYVCAHIYSSLAARKRLRAFGCAQLNTSHSLHTFGCALLVARYWLRVNGRTLLPARIWLRAVGCDLRAISWVKLVKRSWLSATNWVILVKRSWLRAISWAILLARNMLCAFRYIALDGRIWIHPLSFLLPFPCPKGEEGGREGRTAAYNTDWCFVNWFKVS